MTYCSPCRSKHATLIQSCYPGKEGGTTPRSSELSYLTFYASSRPAKLTKVGSFIQRKINKDIRKGRKENNLVSLQILKALIQSCHGDLNIFSKYFVSIFCKLLDTKDIELIDLTCETFIVFCSYHDGSTLGLDNNFTHDYELLLEKISSFYSYKTESQSLKLKLIFNRMKYIGQRGIQAAVTSQALLSSNFKQQLSILLPPLMDTLISNDTLLNQTDGQTIDIRQSALGNDCINEHYIRSVAIHTLSILFNKLTGHYVRISLDLLFNYINENDKWCPPSLSISIMKIVKGSMQSQYKHLFISEILQQLNPNDIMSSKQASIVSILDITLNDDTPLLGVSVLEILNSLFNTLVKAALYNAEDKQHSLEVQQHLIHSIGGLASHTYYENQLYDMASYLASKLKPYTTLDSVDHLPIYKYRCLVLACLDTIHHLPLESLKNGLGLLEDKDTKTRWLFCKSFYQHLKQQQHQQQPNTLLLNELLWTIHNWAQLPNLNLTDVRFIYAILCHLNHMMGMQATIMITSLVFKIQKYVQQDKDTSKQWVIESMIASWLKSTSRFYEIKPLEEYIDRLDQSSSHYPLELSEEANTESIENLPKLNRSKQPLWIDRSQVVEAISSDNKLREKHDVHGLELEAKLSIEWGSEGLVKHGTRLIQGSNNAKPKLSNPWEHGLLEKPLNEKRESIKVAMLKEALSTQPNDDSDSTTQASSNPSEHKPSLNALLTELKLPLNNPTISLVNPPYKS